MKSTSKIAALFGAATLGLAVSGCNTLEGFGKDLTAAGTALSGAAGKDEKKAQQATPAPVQAPAPAPAPAPGPAPAPQRR